MHADINTIAKNSCKIGTYNSKKSGGYIDTNPAPPEVENIKVFLDISTYNS